VCEPDFVCGALVLARRQVALFRSILRVVLLGICAQAQAYGRDRTATAACTVVATDAAVRTVHQTVTRSTVNVAHPAALRNHSHRCHLARAVSIPAAHTGSSRIRLLQPDRLVMGSLVSGVSGLVSSLVCIIVNQQSRDFAGLIILTMYVGRVSDTTWSYKLVAGPTGPISLNTVRELLENSPTEASRQFPSHRVTETRNPVVSYTVNVTNTGTVDADHVILGMLTPPNAGVNGVPIQVLWGFERIHVAAGETVTVSMTPSMTDFTQVDASGLRNAHGGEYTFRFGIEEMPRDQGFLEHVVEAN
jgi:hypothetical protein